MSKTATKLTKQELIQIRAFYEDPTQAPKPKEVCEKFKIKEKTLAYHASKGQWAKPWKAVSLSNKMLSKSAHRVMDEQVQTLVEQRLEEVREEAYEAAKKALILLNENPPEIKDWGDANKAYDLAEKSLGIKKEEDTIKIGVDLNMLSTPVVTGETYDV